MLRKSKMRLRACATAALLEGTANPGDEREEARDVARRHAEHQAAPLATTVALRVPFLQEAEVA